MPKKPKEPEKLGSAEIRDELAVIERETATLRERAAELRPPKPSATDVLAGAGPAWRRAIESDDPAELRAVEDELRDISARTAQLYVQRERLKRRLGEAEREEELACAPGELEELVESLDDRLDEFEASLEAFRHARAALAEWTERVPKLRALLGRDDRCVEPAQLRRLGLALNNRLQELPTEVATDGGRAVVLFGGPGVGERLLDLLGAPELGLLGRISERLRGSFGDPGSAPVYSAGEVRRARYRMLAREADLDDERTLALEVAAGPGVAHRRGEAARTALADLDEADRRRDEAKRKKLAGYAT